MEKLNSISPGWSSCGTLHCNGNPGGGIIDTNILTKKWFVILSDSDSAVSDIDSFDQAVDIFCDMSEKTGCLNE